MSSRAIACLGILLVALPAGAQEGDEPAREEVVRRGTQLRLAHERTLGLVDVEPAQGERPARARVSVSAGPYAFVALLAPGAKLVTGGASLEVVAVEAATLRLARRASGQPTEPLRDAPAAEAGKLRLPEQGLYRLPDGIVVGVGNVRPDGAAKAPVVTLTVYGPGYRERPAQGYDLHVDALAAAAPLAGKVRRVRVHAVVAATETAPATVELELLPVE